jgi:hypothetical protein
MYNSPMRAKNKLRAMTPFNLQYVQMWKRDGSPQNYLHAPDLVHRSQGGGQGAQFDEGDDDHIPGFGGGDGGSDVDGEEEAEEDSWAVEEMEVVVAPKRPLVMHSEHAHSSHSHQMTSSMRDAHESRKEQHQQELQQQLTGEAEAGTGQGAGRGQQQRDAIARLHKGGNETGYKSKQRAKARLEKQQEHDNDDAHAQHVMSNTRKLLQKKKKMVATRQPQENDLLQRLRAEKQQLERPGLPPSKEIVPKLAPPPPVEVVALVVPPPPPQRPEPDVSVLPLHELPCALHSVVNPTPSPCPVVCVC